MRFARLAVAALLVVAPACGGADVSDAAATRLEPKVQALRMAAAAGNRDAAAHELVDLRRLVEELSAADEVSDDGARRILAAADRVEANLGLLATTTTAPPTTTTVPPPPPTTEAEDDDEKEEEKEKDDEEEGKPPEEPVDTTEVEDTTPGKGSGPNGANGRP